MKVDFSKIPEDVLYEYGVEVFDNAKEAFYWVYLDSNTISYNDMLDMLENQSVTEYMETDHYMYKIGDKFYRCTDDEIVDELAELYPDCVVESGIDEILMDANERSVGGPSGTKVKEQEFDR